MSSLATIATISITSILTNVVAPIIRTIVVVISISIIMGITRHSCAVATAGDDDGV